ELAVVLVMSLLQTLQIGRKRRVVRIGSIWFHGGQNNIRRDKTRDVVHVSVRIVADDAALQPNYVGDAEIIMQGTFNLVTRKPRVALLHVTEQAFFGRDECSEAVDVNAAAFKNKWFVVQTRIELPHPEQFGG